MFLLAGHERLCNDSLLAGLVSRSNILCDKVSGFGSGSVVGIPTGTEEDSSGRYSPILHRFVTGMFSGAPNRLTEVNRNRSVEY